jgi:hypothetical protein
MYLFKHLLLLIDLLKGKGHKYIKRVPVGVDKKTGRTRYRYVYNVTHKVHGKHIDDHDNMKVNSKYMFHSEAGEEVHVHVKKVNKDGSLVLMYDDGDKKGEEFTMTKKELAQKLREEHNLVGGMKEKLDSTFKMYQSAKKHGTQKQINRLLKEYKDLYVALIKKDPPSTEEKLKELQEIKDNLQTIKVNERDFINLQAFFENSTDIPKDKKADALTTFKQWELGQKQAEEKQENRFKEKKKEERLESEDYFLKVSQIREEMRRLKQRQGSKPKTSSYVLKMDKLAGELIKIDLEQYPVKKYNDRDSTWMYDRNPLNVHYQAMVKENRLPTGLSGRSSFKRTARDIKDMEERLNNVDPRKSNREGYFLESVIETRVDQRVRLLQVKEAFEKLKKEAEERKNQEPTPDTTPQVSPSGLDRDAIVQGVFNDIKRGNTKLSEQEIRTKLNALMNSIQSYGLRSKEDPTVKNYDSNSEAVTPQDFYAFSNKLMTADKGQNDRHLSSQVIVMKNGSAIRVTGFGVLEGKIKGEGISEGGSSREVAGYIYSKETISQIQKEIDFYRKGTGLYNQDKIDEIKSRFKAGEMYTPEDFDNAMAEIGLNNTTLHSILGTDSVNKAESVANLAGRSVSRSSHLGYNKDIQTGNQFFSIGGKDKAELLKRLKSLKSVLKRGEKSIKLNVENGVLNIEHPSIKSTPLFVIDLETSDGSDEALKSTNVNLDFFISALGSSKDSVSFSQSSMGGSRDYTFLHVDNGSSTSTYAPMAG